MAQNTSALVDQGNTRQNEQQSLSDQIQGSGNVTRLGDLFDFGQLFKPFGNN